VVDAALQVSEYDATWPQKFVEQHDRLAISLQPWLHGSVEHVGSTAVPGLAAKPVVDIAVPVNSLTDAHDARAGLEQDGWRYWSADPNGSWRLWFLRPRPEARTHHLYLIQHDDPHLHELLAFRDQLRADDDLRRRYADLKEVLARAHRHDRDAYTAAKTDFVAKALGQAGIEMLPRTAR
jgi:GrpB-like predicted nucleotidyltransferase (UPF0157 family)